MYAADRTVLFTARPFGNSYTGAVRVAVGDVTGDGVTDVVAVTNGSGSRPARLAVIDGETHGLVSTPLLVPTTYRGVLSVAVGDVTGDGTADVALGLDHNGPRAVVYRGGDFAKLADFRAATKNNFKGRTAVALGDVNDDGRDDLVVAGWYSNGSRVFGFRGDTLAAGVTPVAAFTGFSIGAPLNNGMHLAVGDVNGDGFADLVCGAYSATAARVQVFSGQSLAQNNTLAKIADFTPVGSVGSSGARVALHDLDGDGALDVLASSGELVTGFKGGTLPATGLPPQLFAFDPHAAVAGGVWVG
jgi:hypothetical protein